MTISLLVWLALLTMPLCNPHIELTDITQHQSQELSVSLSTTSGRGTGHLADVACQWQTSASLDTSDGGFTILCTETRDCQWSPTAIPKGLKVLASGDQAATQGSGFAEWKLIQQCHHFHVQEVVPSCVRGQHIMYSVSQIMGELTCSFTWLYLRAFWLRGSASCPILGLPCLP